MRHFLIFSDFIHHAGGFGNVRWKQKNALDERNLGFGFSYESYHYEHYNDEDTLLRTKNIFLENSTRNNII